MPGSCPDRASRDQCEKTLCDSFSLLLWILTTVGYVLSSVWFFFCSALIGSSRQSQPLAGANMPDCSFVCKPPCPVDRHLGRQRPAGRYPRTTSLSTRPACAP